jgi:hypothetical protein
MRPASIATASFLLTASISTLADPMPSKSSDASQGDVFMPDTFPVYGVVFIGFVAESIPRPR